MASAVEGARCGQLELVSDGDCCNGQTERTCGEPATWVHRPSGAALCEHHEKNARMFGGAELGHWTVGRTTVPYPDGWEREDATTAAEQTGGLEIVTFES